MSENRHDWRPTGYPTEIPNTIDVTCASCSLGGVDFYQEGVYRVASGADFVAPPMCPGYECPFTGEHVTN